MQKIIMDTGNILANLKFGSSTARLETVQNMRKTFGSDEFSDEEQSLFLFPKAIDPLIGFEITLISLLVNWIVAWIFMSKYLSYKSI